MVDLYARYLAKETRKKQKKMMLHILNENAERPSNLMAQENVQNVVLKYFKK